MKTGHSKEIEGEIEVTFDRKELSAQKVDQAFSSVTFWFKQDGTPVGSSRATKKKPDGLAGILPPKIAAALAKLAQESVRAFLAGSS